MTYDADERVDAYIRALPDWQQAICREVRELVHAADPEPRRRLAQAQARALASPRPGSFMIMASSGRIGRVCY
jgi:hypothetical protein